MDHLPWSYDLDRPRPRAPYLCAGFEHCICDSPASFSRWPELQGWSLDPNIPIFDSARQCQAWLFFGFMRILTVAVGAKFKLEDYIDQSNTQLVDSTLVSWLISQIYLPKKSRFGIFHGQTPSVVRLQSLIRQFARDTIARQVHWISSILQQLDSRTDVYSPWDCEMFNVFWSTTMLLELATEQPDIEAIYKRTLNDPSMKEGRALSLFRLSEPAITELATELGIEELSAEQASSIELNNERATSTAVELSFLRHNSHITEGLRSLGRCPTLLARTRPSPLAVYRLMSFPCYSRASHGECEGRNCRAWMICEETYQMRHTRSCTPQGHCPLLRVDQKSLEHLVQGDYNAVVRSRLGEDDVLEVEIVDGTEILNITAISHVWAGGLGNFKENEHYHCQLKQLHQYLAHHSTSRRRSSTVYYWLDTLCIPAHQGLLKTRAINAMASSYAKCKSVLVIDPDLSTVATNHLDSKQIKSALVNSPWMARSWTLQEAALSVELGFVFADRVVPFAELDDEQELLETTTLPSLWKMDVSIWAPAEHAEVFKWLDIGWPDTGKKKATNPNFQPHRKFMMAWNELCNRKSTKLDDLPTILAVFLGCSAGELLMLPRAERLRALLNTQSELPVSILFAPTNLETEAWCPSFPTCAEPSNLLTDVMGFMKVTPKGYFGITELRSANLFRCSKMLPMHGTARCHDLAKDRHLEIHFSDHHLASAHPQENIVFLLSSSTTGDSSKDHGSGLCFTAVTDNERGVHAHFVKSCTWRVADSTGDNRLDSLLYAVRNGWFSAIRIDRICITHTFPLTLDMGTTWPRLKWSRPAFYPFIGTALNTAQLLNTSIYLTPIIYFCALTPTALFVLCEILRLGKILEIGIVVERQPLALCIAAIVFNVGMVWLRVLLARHEYSWFRQIMHQNLQRIWAASFKSSELQQGPMQLLHRSQYRLLISGGVILGVVLIGSIVSIVSLLRYGPTTDTCEPDWPHASCIVIVYSTILFRPKVSDPLWLTLAKPSIIATAIELFCRFLVLAWFRPWRVPLNADDLMKRSSVHGPETVLKAQYNLAERMAAVTTTVMCLAIFVFVVSFSYSFIFYSDYSLWLRSFLFFEILFFTALAIYSVCFLLDWDDLPKSLLNLISEL